MDIATRLDLFLDVVQQGSFAKAADLRHLDRSVVSKQIKVLEDNLGVRLLNRSTRSLSVTDAGGQIAKQAESIRNKLTETQMLAASYHTEARGLLRITSPTIFGQMYLTKAVHLFMKKYPETHIDLVLNDKRADLINERIDIAFRAGPLRDSNLIAKPIAENGVALIAAKSFIAEHGEPKTPEELVKLPAVIYTSSALTIDRFDMSVAPGSDETKTYLMQGRYSVNDIGSAIKSVEMGIGYALATLPMLSKNINELDIVPLLTNYRFKSSYGKISAVYPHRNQTPLVKLFIETVHEVIGTPPIWESYIDNYADYYK